VRERITSYTTRPIDTVRPGWTLSFYRRSQPDYGLVYRERRKVLARNLGGDEAHFRAFDFTAVFAAIIPIATLRKRRRWAAIAKAAAP
jgi:hypothetical protein